MSDRLRGRIAIVTGGAAGIGQATARLFANEGAHVVVLDKDGAGAESVAAEITERGGTAAARTTDVSRADEAEAAVAFAVERFGTVDVLVNNAGIELKRPVEETTEEEWDRVLAVNLKSVFLMSKNVIGIMKAKRRGAIVNNSSVGYFIAAPNSAAYGASKAGMMALTRGMALELAPFNIRVNAVCPGVIDTPMNERNLMRADDPDAMRRSWFEVTPLNRLGRPEDVANAMLFLACDESDFITGTPLIIDGGRTAQ
ncbi:MAG TPA: glucose 1-dehydrogenase [Vicinamibacterales bacterium]|nr:glucose 1-dehydrogenase [Vicinamibacterales bacterium]